MGCTGPSGELAPAPDGPFDLTMRSYSPVAPVLTGSSRLPAVTREGRVAVRHADADGDRRDVRVDASRSDPNVARDATIL